MGKRKNKKDRLSDLLGIGTDYLIYWVRAGPPSRGGKSFRFSKQIPLVTISRCSDSHTGCLWVFILPLAGSGPIIGGPWLNWDIIPCILELDGSNSYAAIISLFESSIFFVSYTYVHVIMSPGPLVVITSISVQR